MLCTCYLRTGDTNVDVYPTPGIYFAFTMAYDVLTNFYSSYQPVSRDEMPTRRSLTATRSTSWIEPEDEPHILTDPMALPAEEDKLGVRETAGVAVWWGIVWYIGNWLNNTALGMTSVASMTIIATTSGVWMSLPGVEIKELIR
jgi:hypothetical protein